MSAAEHELGSYEVEEAFEYAVLHFHDEGQAERVFRSYVEEENLRDVGLFGVNAAYSFQTLYAAQPDETIIARKRERENLEDIAEDVLGS